MAVALLASHTDLSMAGSADVVPSGCPCGILLYWGCPLETLGWAMADLTGRRDGGEVLKRLVYCIRKYGARQMEKFVSPFKIR